MNTTYDYIIKNGKLVWANPDVYLESTGTQKILTDFSANVKTKVETSVQFTSTGQGHRESMGFGEETGTYWGARNGLFQIDAIIITNSPSALDRHFVTFSIDISENKYDSELYVDEGSYFLTTIHPYIAKQYALFGLRRVNTYNCLCKIYFCRMYNNDVLEKYLVPVPAGMIIGNYTVPSNGMFDIVEQKFYGNTGTGSFIYQGVFKNILYINDEPNHKRIRKSGKFITTKRKKGGPRYLTDVPKPSSRGPVLLGNYNYTLGLKSSSKDFLFYKSDHTPGTKFSFSINTTLNPSNPSDNTYTIPLWKYAPTFSFIVNWGDGTYTIFPAGKEFTLEDRTHTYSSPGSYTITLYSETGIMPPFVNNIMEGESYNYNNQKIISINSPFIKYDKESPHPNLNSCLADAVNLFYIPDSLFRFNSTCDNYDSAFLNCTSLSSIPSELFLYATTNPTRFNNCFSGCTSLTKIPKGLMVRTFPYDTSRMFYNCTGLDGWINMEVIFGYESGFNTSVVDVHEMFYNCSKSRGDAEAFVDYVGENKDDAKKINALYGCTLWDSYAYVDNIWTSFLDSNPNVLLTDSTLNNWFMVDRNNYLDIG